MKPGLGDMVRSHVPRGFQLTVRGGGQQGDNQVLQRNDAYMKRTEFSVARLEKGRLLLGNMRVSLRPVYLGTSLLVRTSTRSCNG